MDQRQELEQKNADERLKIEEAKRKAENERREREELRRRKQELEREVAQLEVNLFQKYLFLHQQYDKGMSSELPVLHMKIPSSEHGENMGEHVVYINCSECQLSKQKQFVCTSCSPHVLPMF